MFEGFAHVWTPVVPARTLGKKPLPVTLAGERLVFFRDASGTAHALLDRCPHRGVALSLGRVTAEGRLECPFHAWQFDGTGAVCHVPLNPDAKRERLFGHAVPVRELGGLLWAYTAPVARAPSEPVLPDGLTRPDLMRNALQLEWNAHWTRVMENMLDSPHVPFVHATTIGRFVRPHLRPDSRMDIAWVETDWGGRTRSTLDGREDTGAWLDFHRPNMMTLHIPVPRQVFRMHALCVPIDQRRARLIVVGARSFAKLRLLNPLFNHSNAKIAEQDRAVIESSQPAEVPPPSQELSVRTDRATLQFRRYYFERLRGSSAAPHRRSDEPLSSAG